MEPCKSDATCLLQGVLRRVCNTLTPPTLHILAQSLRDTQYIEIIILLFDETTDMTQVTQCLCSRCRYLPSPERCHIYGGIADPAATSVCARNSRAA